MIATSASRARARLAGLALLVVMLPARAALTQGKKDGAKPKPTPAAGEIRFTSELRGSKGHVICALFRKAGWLKSPVARAKADIANKTSECVFSNVAPGVYGIVAFHDENDSGELDTGLFGIPTEDWCASRDAKGFMGPPSFDSAKFSFKGGAARLRCKV